MYSNLQLLKSNIFVFLPIKFFLKNIVMKDYKNFMINNNIIIKKYFTLTFLFLNCFLNFMFSFQLL